MPFKVIKVEFSDEWEVEDTLSMEQVYDQFLDYLNECVRNEDLTAFDFKEV